MKEITVAVGVVFNCDKGVFICKRADHQHQGGKWEFPGGKVEVNESIYDALVRELYEELGIEVNAADHLLEIKHDYIDKKVKLSVWMVTDYDGTPHSNEGLEERWCLLSELQSKDFPAANITIIEHLQKNI